MDLFWKINIYNLLFILSNVAADKIITTSNGQVKGVTLSDIGSSIEAFFGIPYAEPPIGDLRFKKPLPKKPWSDVYNASSLPPSCLQGTTGEYFEVSLGFPMSEDCLFLNLWVPFSKDSKPKTVMVYIHGGALVMGSASMWQYDGTKLANKGDVIVASMNYRLGAFGFLFADTDEAKGSMGMLDQIMALKWIKANAKAFGGDPDNIVLFGESSGSWSIGYHLMSPLSKHLFRRVIMQSGSPTLPETLNNNHLVEASRTVAFLSGCDANKTMFRNNASEVVTCMKGLPAQVIAQADISLLKMMHLPYLPSIGGDFLPRSPSYLLSHAHFQNTEILIGNNEEEGPFFLAFAAPKYFRHREVKIPSKRLAINLLRMLLKKIGTIKGEKKVIKFYINKNMNGTYLDDIGHAFGDYYITCSTFFYAEIASLKNPVYYYVMKFRPPLSPLGEWAKMTHFDEVQYVFGNPLFGNFTAEEETFSDKIMRRWVAFAKTGNPNIPGEVKWPLFKYDEYKYMALSKNDMVHSDRLDAGRCEFWRKRDKSVIDEKVLERFRHKSLNVNQI